jgi:hypothetical protein
MHLLCNLENLTVAEVASKVSATVLSRAVTVSFDILIE